MELKRWSLAYMDDLVYHGNNKKIADHLRDVFPHPYTKENARQFIELCIHSPEYRAIHRAIINDHKSVGAISLIIGEDVHSKSAEIGYWLGEEYWRQGIATKAVKEMCHMAFSELGLHRVYAHVFSYNTGSCMVLKKSGFEMEGVLRKSIWKNGQIYDSFMYSRTN